MKDGLVTMIGGGGFVGRYVAQALFKTGIRVRIAQRDPRAAYFLKPLSALGQTQIVAADVTRPDSIAHAVDGADVVINLVGVLAGDFHRYHVDGARTVAEAAAKAGASALVHVSAIGADTASPSAYGRSKGEGEAAARDAFPSAAILRPSVVFGQEDAFLNRFASMIARLPIIPVLRSATRFQPVFVGDVAHAIRVAATEPERLAAWGAGVTAELGGPDVLSMAELQHWIAATLHRRPTFIELPDLVGAGIARAGFLPGAPITRDQWLMLGRDNVVADGARGLADLGITPTPMELVAPVWLVRFRKLGRFARRAEDLVAAK